MGSYVRAPASSTTSGTTLDIKFNEDFLFHTASSSTQAQLSSLTMSGMEDYELTWFGLAIGGNTSNITSTTFDIDMDNSNMTKAFDSSTGCDFDLTISKSAPSDTAAPDMLDRLFPIVESDYATFSNATASTYSEAFKEIWTGGKLRNDTSDDAYSSYAHSGITLDFANSPMGTGGHRFSNDDTNILFLGFWGPGRYVKEAAKRIKIRPTTNTSTEYVLMACVRTESVDTVFSPVAKLRESTATFISTVVPSSGATFIYNQGEESSVFNSSTYKDTSTGLIDNVVYPHTSLVQLSYPRASTFKDDDDPTTFAFIYEGIKVPSFSAGPSGAGEDPTRGSAAHSSTTALVALDYITHKRYGMGEMIADVNRTGQSSGNEQAAKINNQLFEAKTRCEDVLTVTSTTGSTSTQNRYGFNSVIDSDTDKFETLTKILNNMHSDFYFHNGFLNIYQDRPVDPVKIVNQSNAQNIKFTGRNHLPEVNTMYVKFNNERKMFRQDIAFDELRDQLNTGMPVVSKEVITEGITNKDQALRHSRYLLENARTKNEFVTYTAGADHIYMKPGDLIFADSTEDNGKKHSGRILSISSTTATIDGAIEINGNKSYRVLIENGFTGSNEYNAHEQTVVNNPIFETSLIIPFSGTTTEQTTLQLGSVTGLNDINAGKSALTDFNGQAFILIENTSPATKPYQQEKIYRIQSITETSPFVYEVVAQRYDQNKWLTVDEGYSFGYTLTATSIPTTYTES